MESNLQNSEIKKNLETHRSQIDSIDQEILKLINLRASHALEIGLIKKQNQLPVYDPNREKSILTRIASSTQGPLPAESIEEIFRGIIHQCRELENRTHG